MGLIFGFSLSSYFQTTDDREQQSVLSLIPSDSTYNTLLSEL